MDFQINYQAEIKQQLELAKKQELIGKDPTIKVLKLLDIDPTNEDCIEYLLDYELKFVKNIYDMKMSNFRPDKNDQTEIARMARTFFEFGQTSGKYNCDNCGNVFSSFEFKNEFLCKFFTLQKYYDIEKNIKACNNSKFNLKLDEIKQYKIKLFDFSYDKVISQIKEHNKPYEYSKKNNTISIITGILSAFVFIFSIVLAISNSSFVLFIVGIVIAIILCVISSATNVKHGYDEGETYYNADSKIINII